MKHTGKYCRVEDEYDIDHEISQAVELTKEFVVKITDNAQSTKDAKAILSAVISTMAEELAKI